MRCEECWLTKCIHYMHQSKHQQCILNSYIPIPKWLSLIIIICITHHAMTNVSTYACSYNDHIRCCIINAGIHSFAWNKLQQRRGIKEECKDHCEKQGCCWNRNEHKVITDSFFKKNPVVWVMYIYTYTQWSLYKVA